MVRSKRVLSFMSEWGGGHSNHRRNASSTAASPAPASPTKQPTATTTENPFASSATLDNNSSPGPSARPRSDSRPSSRPMSMIQTYQPPMMEVSQDTLPELQRIFTFLNSHSNKLYQEGYFLKFHDTDSRGRPAPDRAWQECFAQLVGTVLSLWDASELDKVGAGAEVLPTFINLTDAALHMMPSMVLNDGKKLENILSVSTAASNKYLFHFNSFNSLTQWTAGIRLAMYEHTTLQEAYTGALIAGKGKSLNNIRVILDRQRAVHEDWARVRFGAGTPWRRCWCVVTPPDEKEYARLQKTQKKGNVYNRSPIVLRGDVRLYDTKKVTKKTRPIATIREAYSCYAIYPQSKPLIDQSTLVKIEGKITIHSKPESTTEGFVFVMPETHPAVSGFEIMLRFLFPVFDTFALYGRPQKLIADVLDTRGLMFAMPSDRRYGYLEMWDVVSLIHAEGSQDWSERQWRKQLKDLTSKRMASIPARESSRSSSRRNTVGRISLPPSRSANLRFEETSIRSQPSSRHSSPSRRAEFAVQGPPRVDSAPPTTTFAAPRHQRSISEANGYRQYRTDAPTRFAPTDAYDIPPTPPEHRELPQQTSYENYSDGEGPSPMRDLPEVQVAPTAPPRGPVDAPPSFAHAPSQRPPILPHHPPPMMKPNAQMDPATLHQLADATHTPLPPGIAVAGAAAAWRSQENLQSRKSGDYDRSGSPMHLNANNRGYPADQYMQSANSSRSGHSGSRLSTIPASPYIEQPEFMDSPVAFQPAAPPVPEHTELPPVQPAAELGQPPHAGSSSNLVHRKPVPGPSTILSEHDNASTKSSSLGSLRNDVIDPEALDRLRDADQMMPRNHSLTSSRHDADSLSISTPDYASVASEEVQLKKVPDRRADRPRSGILKSVGDPKLNAKADVAGESSETSVTTDIPTVDFGPTLNLAATTSSKRPSTSGTMTQMLHDNSFSKSAENLASSPGDQRRKSYLSGRTTPNAAAHIRGSSPSPQLSDGRSVVWQPGMTSQPHPDRQKLDADEWVAQRAAAAYASRTSPVYVNHGRSQSRTPPPMNRTHSGDWTQLQRTPGGSPGRPPSRPLSRPLSRGAAHLLDQRPTSLSAREQEEISRMTGTALVDLNHNPRHTQQPSSAGLTAYIDQREKEKAKAKTHRSTAAMQAEIDRRMMVAQQRQMAEIRQMNHQQMMMAQGGYGPPSMMGTSPGYHQQAFAYHSPGPMQQTYPQQQQGYFPQPGMSPGMAQGMVPGWGTPSPRPMSSPYFVQQQPQQQPPVTQPYGASFDQAQAAARFAHQQGQNRRG